MACVHLQQLYKLCQDQQLKLGGADLIRVVCTQCGDQEVCPSTMMDTYDTKRPELEINIEKEWTADIGG